MWEVALRKKGVDQLIPFRIAVKCSYLHLLARIKKPHYILYSYNNQMDNSHYNYTWSIRDRQTYKS